MRWKVMKALAVASVALFVGVVFHTEATCGGRLAQTEMAVILGRCGCHHTSYGDCGGSGSSADCWDCKPSGTMCEGWTVGGSQAQTCEFRAPKNSLTCEPTGSSTLCKTNYVCTSQTVVDEHCFETKGCQPDTTDNCEECDLIDVIDIELPNYHCTAP